MMTFLHLKCIMANANFPLVQFLCHHFIFGSVSTFKDDDVSMPKPFMCAHSRMMTFVHLKVHNGRCKFSVDLFFQIFHWFGFPHHCTLGSVLTFKHGYA